jgi:hypothetical protein
MKKKPDQFKKWFKDQYGRVPKFGEVARDLYVRMRNTEFVAKDARRDFEFNVTLQAKWEAAFRAWHKYEEKK